MSRRAREMLAALCQPKPETGYDHQAIADALTAGERHALALLGGDDVERAAGALLDEAADLVSVGLAVAGQPPQLSILGAEVLERVEAAAASFDD